MALLQIKTGSISVKKLAIFFLYVLVGYLPFNSLLSVFVPQAGWLKDILCILICCLALYGGKLRLNWVSGSALLYTALVIAGLILNDASSFSVKLDAFRYRSEYAISLSMLFNSFIFSREEIRKFTDTLLKIVYYTGMVVALIGLVEIINPSLVHSIYGSSLTTHLSLNMNGGISSRLVSTMTNPINLGLQMSLSTIAALYLLHKNAFGLSKKMKIIHIFSIFLFAFIAIFTYSRTAYAAIIAMVGVFYFIIIFGARGKVTEKIAFVFSVVILGVALLIFLNSNEAFAARVGRLNLESFLENLRFTRAQETFATAGGSLLNLIFGYGIGIVLGASGQFVFELGYASLLFESGLLGLSIFALVCFKCVQYVHRLLSIKGRDSYLVTALLAVVVGFCVAMMAGDVYFQLPFCLYFWLAVFCLYRIYTSEVKK